MSFVESAAKESASQGCFLCEKPAEPRERDAANLVLHRGERAYVLLNLYPYNSGHAMIAPYEHTGNMAGLEPATATELMAITQRTVGVIQQEYRPDGLNVGMNLGKAAGAGVPNHLHVHVVPRWNGDTNFMPVLGETKVIPESVEQTYRRLLPYFQERGP